MTATKTIMTTIMRTTIMTAANRMTAKRRPIRSTR